MFICFYRCRKLKIHNLNGKETLHRTLNEQRKTNNVYLKQEHTTTNQHNVTDKYKKKYTKNKATSFFKHRETTKTETNVHITNKINKIKMKKELKN